MQTVPSKGQRKIPWQPRKLHHDELRGHKDKERNYSQNQVPKNEKDKIVELCQNGARKNIVAKRYRSEAAFDEPKSELVEFAFFRVANSSYWHWLHPEWQPDAAPPDYEETRECIGRRWVVWAHEYCARYIITKGQARSIPRFLLVGCDWRWQRWSSTSQARDARCSWDTQTPWRNGCSWGQVAQAWLHRLLHKCAHLK